MKALTEERGSRIESDLAVIGIVVVIIIIVMIELVVQTSDWTAAISLKAHLQR